jgi:hypothetical protein
VVTRLCPSLPLPSPGPRRCQLPAPWPSPWRPGWWCPPPWGVGGGRGGERNRVGGGHQTHFTPGCCRGTGQACKQSLMFDQTHPRSCHRKLLEHHHVPGLVQDLCIAVRNPEQGPSHGDGLCILVVGVLLRHLPECSLSAPPTARSPLPTPKSCTQSPGCSQPQYARLPRPSSPFPLPLSQPHLSTCTVSWCWLMVVSCCPSFRSAAATAGPPTVW